MTGNYGRYAGSASWRNCGKCAINVKFAELLQQMMRTVATRENNQHIYNDMRQLKFHFLFLFGTPSARKYLNTYVPPSNKI